MAMRDGSDDGNPMMEMNTTPLIDVMLVLLIMFIIALPRPTHGVKVDLPASDEFKEFTPANRLAIAADGTLRWNGVAIDMMTLRRNLGQTVTMVPQPELQFQPDAEARYARVDETVAAIKRAGVTRLGFIGNERYQDAF